MSVVLGEKLEQLALNEFRGWPDEGVSPVFILFHDASAERNATSAAARRLATRLKRVDLETFSELSELAYQKLTDAYTPAHISIRSSSAYLIVRVETDGLNESGLTRSFVNIIRSELASSLQFELELFDQDADWNLWASAQPLTGPSGSSSVSGV